MPFPYPSPAQRSGSSGLGGIREQEVAAKALWRTTEPRMGLFILCVRWFIVCNASHGTARSGQKISAPPTGILAFHDLDDGLRHGLSSICLQGCGMIPLSLAARGDKGFCIARPEAGAAAGLLRRRSHPSPRTGIWTIPINRIRGKIVQIKGHAASLRHPKEKKTGADAPFGRLAPRWV